MSHISSYSLFCLSKRRKTKDAHFTVIHRKAVKLSVNALDQWHFYIFTFQVSHIGGLSLSPCLKLQVRDLWVYWVGPVCGTDQTHRSFTFSHTLVLPGFVGVMQSWCQSRTSGVSLPVLSSCSKGKSWGEIEWRLHAVSESSVSTLNAQSPLTLAIQFAFWMCSSLVNGAALWSIMQQ